MGEVVEMPTLASVFNTARDAGLSPNDICLAVVAVFPRTTVQQLDALMAGETCDARQRLDDKRAEFAAAERLYRTNLVMEPLAEGA